MIHTTLVQAGGQDALHTAEVSPSPEPVLVTENLHRIHGTFRSATSTGAATTTIATPELDQEIVLTDLIVSTDKVNGATIIVRWIDDLSNSVIIYNGTATDAPINVAIAFAGRWAGWMNARLEMVTVGVNLEANVSIGYYKLPEGLTYEQWDALR